MMRISEKNDAEIRALYDAVREVGVDFFDHADIYGGSMHLCETRFAEALQLSTAERAEITIQTKCGIVPAQQMFDFSYEHIVRQVEGSLHALNTDYTTCCFCIARMLWSSPPRLPVRLTSSKHPAKCGHLAFRITPRDRSTC